MSSRNHGQNLNDSEIHRLREFLSSYNSKQSDTDLNEGEKQLLRELLDSYRALKLLSRVSKWMFFVILGLAMHLAGFLDNFYKILGNLKKILYN